MTRAVAYPPAMADPNTGNTDGQPMNSLPSVVVTRYQAEITKWTAIHDAANEALLARLSGRPIDEYEFQTADGKQKAKSMNLTELYKLVDWTSNQIRKFEQRLYGRGIMNIRLRRKP